MRILSGESARKEMPSYTADGVGNWYIPFGKQFEVQVAKFLKFCMLFDSVIPHLGIHLKAINMDGHENGSIKIFITWLFLVLNSSKQS